MAEKSLLVTIPLMTRTHLCTQIICRDFTYNFFYPAKLFVYHFLFYHSTHKKLLTQPETCAILSTKSNETTQKGRFIMTEKEKMLAGKIYDSSDKELAELRTKAHKLSQQYSSLYEDDERRKAILDELLPDHGEGFFLQGPVYFDYGVFTKFGSGCYANFNLTVLDTCPVTIGDNVFFGPNCTIATPVHPFRWQERNMKKKSDGTVYDDEYGKPITIHSNCWIASNVVITGGVTIGEGCVIGAGSVVTRDIPPNSLAAGNPCRVIREITEEDSIKYKADLF